MARKRKPKQKKENKHMLDKMESAGKPHFVKLDDSGKPVRDNQGRPVELKQ